MAPQRIETGKTKQAKPRVQGALGVRFHGQRSIIQRLREGLPATTVDHICKRMKITVSQLSVAVNITPRTIARRKREGKLHQDESERIFRLGTLFDKAIEVLDGEERARRWFNTPIRVLDYQTPLQYCDTEIGAREVEDLLGRIEHGIFS